MLGSEKPKSRKVRYDRLWIGRNGPADPIKPRFEQFVEKELSGRSLDLEGDIEKRPDYECLGGSVAIEIKCLEGSPAERVGNAVEPATQSPNWPKFMGAWPLKSVLKNLPAPERENLNRVIHDRLGRAIVTHMKKADDQLEAYGQKHKDVHLRVMVLINEDFPEYTPDTVAYVVKKELLKRRGQGYRYANIDAVLYLTERHATASGGSAYFPVTLIHGRSIEDRPISQELMRWLMTRWGRHSELEDLEGLPTDFVGEMTIEQNPTKLRRQDLWELDYKRRPFMGSWSDDDVIGYWDFIVITMGAIHMRDCPLKMPLHGSMKFIEAFAQLQIEVSVRGITLPRLKCTRERYEIVVGKLGAKYGPVMIDWLRKNPPPFDD